MHPKAKNLKIESGTQYNRGNKLMRSKKHHKGLFSMSENGVCYKILARYTESTENIGIYGQFSLSHGFNDGMRHNKDSAQYFGLHVAENALSKIFNDVELMPYANPGYDFVCKHGLKIDVKASTQRGGYNGWSFYIGKNRITDYFLCVAFNDRIDLDPIHLWLLPAALVNERTQVSISRSSLDKWTQYELTDKLTELQSFIGSGTDSHITEVNIK